MKIVKILYVVGAVVGFVGLALQLIFWNSLQADLLGHKIVFSGITIVFAGMIVCFKILFD